MDALLEYINGLAMMALGFFLVAEWLLQKRGPCKVSDAPIVIVSLGLFAHGFHHVVLKGTIIGDIGDSLIWIGALANFIVAHAIYKKTKED